MAERDTQDQAEKEPQGGEVTVNVNNGGNGGSAEGQESQDSGSESQGSQSKR